MPKPAHPYLTLMRIDRPIGTWLLLLPGLWSITLAATVDGAAPHWGYMALFALGALIMRGAGCTINDIWDRDFDGGVERTANRPIPSGDVSVRGALVFLAGLLLAGLAILLQFNLFAVAVGAASLVLVVVYPLMKRITYWPQAFLGVTFNWGALLGWAAATGALGLPAFLLYAAGFFWTLGYDTIYAHQDKRDDALLGLKSTALKLGETSPKWVAGFYILTWLGIVTAGLAAGLDPVFAGLMLPAGAQLFWQVRTWHMDDGPNCLRRFKSNRDFGLLVWAAILLSLPV